MAYIVNITQRNGVKIMANQLPAHFFVIGGALYDTRIEEWHKSPPLRPVYKRHFSVIDTTEQFKASLRAGGHAFPGDYSLAFITTDGGAFCFDCARKEARLIMDSIRGGYHDGWQVNGLINADEHEGTTRCDHCNGIISGPFGDD